MRHGRGTRGQSTVEYAVVLFAFLALVAALGALWHAGRDGKLLNLAIQAASHLCSGAGLDPSALLHAEDVLLF